MEVREASVAYAVHAATTADGVPVGYKRTEVGVIPLDWEVWPMGALGAFSKGQGIRKNEAESGDIPCVRYGEIYTYHSDIVRSFNSGISIDVARTSKRLRNGDILFAGSGETKEEIGKCVAYVGQDEVYAGSDIVILSPSKGVSAYFGYLFNAPIIARQKSSKGQGDAVVHISASALASIKLPLPATRAEQEAIAEALFDADALIESLEQLLSKKRQIKQGAMQELLTGKKRLPGFSGDWIETIFEDVAARRTQRINPRRSGVQDFCVELEHIESGSGVINGYTTTTSQSSLKAVFQPGDVLFGKLRAYLRKYWLANRHGVCSTEIWCLIPKGALRSSAMLFQLIQMDAFIEAASMAYGTHMPRSDWNAVKGFVLELPSDESEQFAIAAVLSDMDAEFSALESRLTKARQLKQGMLQVLLTGKVRLLSPQSREAEPC